MLPPIPVLADYGLSPTHGFLPDTPPLTRLPDPYYHRWEAVAANLQAAVLGRRLRGVVDGWPVLSTAGLEHEAEWRRAYSLLCFVAHAYVWGGDEPADRLPPPLAVPLLAVARRLQLPPVATYAAVCLWNFKPLFLDEPADRLENLATLHTFTGALDESWFYLVSVAIEARGAPVLAPVLAAMAAARRRDSPAVARGLRAFAERLTDLTAILQRIHESCDPVIFYHRVRPFLAGSKDMAEAGLPRGLLYDDGSGAQSYHQYSGGSNAQSSLIQFFDIALGVHHRHAFIQDMRRYMPGPHARFLDDVSRVANIRQYVEEHPDDRDLCLTYDACLAMLSAFRDKHMAIVARYIINPSREARARSRSHGREPAPRKRLNLATASQGTAQKGTGGTALIPFLKQARDETAEPAVEEWTRRFMKRSAGADHRAQGLSPWPDHTAPSDSVEVKGLAWTWTMDDDFGGICLV